ncbi:MAG: general secretion pathway protein GspK [Bdellovibrionales bacterium]
MIKNRMPSPFRILRQRRGVAILVALFAIMLLIFVATEVSYDTSVEYIVARQQVNRLKAYYAARAGTEISLLRILIYKKAVAAVTSSLGDNAKQQMAMLDPVWQMPFTWPPVLPDTVTGVDRSNIEDIVKESTLDAQYLATIESEGGKIDINDLGSISKPLREATKAQILKIFISETDNNDDFRQKYRDFRFEELVNNMIDWVDDDSESLNGGGERDKYDVRSDFIPPNAPFKTFKELNMVAMMNEDFYNLLINRVTIFGTKGINVNYAPREVLAALDPSMREDALNAILKRRSDPNEGGPFQNEEDFFTFASRQNVNTQAIQKSGVPLLFGTEYNFRIRSTGRYSNVNREITSITFDLENLRDRYLGLLDKEAENKNNNGGASSATGNTGAVTTPSGPAAAEKPKIVAPKGRPTVVYWDET